MPSVSEDLRLEIGRGLLGNRLRDTRIRSTLDVNEVCDLSGISGSYLYDLERGRTLPSMQALLRLADTYEVLVSDLLKGVYPFGSRHKPRNPPQPPPTPDGPQP